MKKKLTNLDKNVSLKIGLDDADPDTVALELNDRRTDRLSNLCLHFSDLDFARDCMNRLKTEKDDVIRNALLQACILNYIKCFKSNKQGGRSATLNKSLFSDDIDKHNHNFFNDIRNLRIAHDENLLQGSMTQALFRLKLSGDKLTTAVTVEAVNATVIIGDEDELEALESLISIAIAWVEARIQKIKSDLELELLRDKKVMKEVVETWEGRRRRPTSRANE